MKNLGFLGFDKYAASSCGRIYSIRSGRFLSPVEQITGYLMVTLSQDGNKRGFLVHRLIAMAFFGLPNEDTLQVNHKNGNKTDNRASNLEWMTPQENVQHSVITGLRCSVKNPYRSLDDETVHKVCQLIEDSWRNKDISEALGVKQSIIANIRFGHDYFDISSQYDFSNTLPSRRKLSTDKLIKICEMLQDKKSYAEIAKEVCVSSATISNIRRRKTGIYISKNYKFD